MINFKRLRKLGSITLLSALILSIGACASMQNPQGGPKDTTPPKVLKMDPKNLTTNFKTNKIVIEFDEYIKLQDQFKEFSITPEQERPPILKEKLRRLEITLQDSLEKNTTYTLNFGKSIVDINEANALKNFTYVFSTGPVLDSLSISGTVRNAVTGKPELETLVFILPFKRDSIFGKKKPSIYTLTDSSGNFRLNNLRKDTYKIYALKEKSGDKIYQQANDEIAFIKEPLTLEKNIDTVNLYIFKELAKTFRIEDKRINADGFISMNFNQRLKKPEITVIEPNAYDANKIVRFNKTNDSVKFWLNKMDFDSIKVAIKDNGIALDTVKLARGKRETYSTEIKAGDNLEGPSLNPTRPLKLYFNFPISNIDLTKVVLLEDSIPRKLFTVTKDSTDILAYNVRYNWKPNEEYILQLKEGAVTGLYGSKNKEIRKTFKLGKAEDYATLILNVQVQDTSKSYIIELINDKRDVIFATEQISKNKTITFSNYRAGVYFIRVAYDENKNGIWDTGNVKEGIQPEKYWYESKEMSIRANWDRKETIKIPTIEELKTLPPPAPDPVPAKPQINAAPIDNNNPATRGRNSNGVRRQD